MQLAAVAPAVVVTVMVPGVTYGCGCRECSREGVAKSLLDVLSNRVGRVERHGTEAAAAAGVVPVVTLILPPHHAWPAGNPPVRAFDRSGWCRAGARVGGDSRRGRVALELAHSHRGVGLVEAHDRSGAVPILNPNALAELVPGRKMTGPGPCLASA